MSEVIQLLWKVTLVNLFCDFFRYGGPGGQFVTKKWRQDDKEGFDFYLAGKKNYIVAKIDVRGTSFSGKLHKKAKFCSLQPNVANFLAIMAIFDKRGKKC